MPRAPWKIAGVDYAVGVPSGTSLANPSTISMSGVSVDAGSHTITISGSNVTLSGYDFGLNGGWGIYVAPGATNLTIKNSHFLVGANEIVPISAAVGSGNLTVLDNTFDGGGGTGSAVWAMINYNGSGTFTAKYNAFLNIPDDAIDFNSGTMTTVVEYNLFENLGTSPGSHPDAVQYVGVKGSNSIEAFNTIYQPNPGGMQGIQLEAQNGSTLTNTQLQNNTIVAKAGSSVKMSYSVAVIQDSGNTINGAVVSNNYIDYSGAYGPFYPPSGSNLTFGGNVNMSTGATIATPRHRYAKRCGHNGPDQSL
ncbi:MAG: right-handed parallel beta-helix repeat-containing protein [Rhodopila sp.]